jgi:thiol-disulfide isomerase/thioredoxin
MISNKKKNFTLLLLTLCCVVFSQVKKMAPLQAVQSKKNAQNGYVINIETKNLAQEKILFYIIYGPMKQKMIIDSLTLKSNNQKVVIQSDKKIIGAIYYLQIAKDDRAIGLAITNNSKINLELDNKNIESIKCTLSEENQAFINYQNQNKKTDKSLLSVTRNSLLKKYPNSVLNLYFKIENKIAETLPQTLEDKIKYRDSFFNFLDREDKRIYLIPNIYKLLFRYITILPINNENYSQNIDLLFKGLYCGTQNYTVYTKWVLSNLNFYESKNLEKTYTYFYKKYVEDVKCDVLTNAEKNIEKNKYITSTKLPNGSTVPDFSLVDSNLTENKLATIYLQNDYTFLIFFSPSCQHCQETLPKVKNVFDQLIAFYPTHKIKVVTVLNDPEENLWAKFITDNKLESWLNLKNIDPKKKYQEDFNTYSNPNFFLIDGKGKIIMKSYNPNAIAMIFKENLKKNN